MSDLSEAVTLRYQSMGLKAEIIEDEEGKTWGPHTHEETYVFILYGTLKIKLDNEQWITLKPNDELVIENEQLHETIALKDGCKYIVAS